MYSQKKKTMNKAQGIHGEDGDVCSEIEDATSLEADKKKIKRLNGMDADSAAPKREKYPNY